ncbi:MAG: stage V sporulation protein AD [Ruminococcaceae bacterium]|nr:stage V sporulation protein AD [Oscillospiraceae bacterium]
MPKRCGLHTIRLPSGPAILGYAAVGGKKEGEGPLGGQFDAIFRDARLGQETWEQAESALQREALSRAVTKAGLETEELQMLFAGDLLNQNIASTYGLREMGVPLLGQFGACSTMGQTMAVAAVFVDSGAAAPCGAVTSSHFCTAERQFRFPLEYGGQRTPTSQWTATASGAVVVGQGKGVRIRRVCVGRVQDLGVTDMNNMGAAMAPAAADTIGRFLRDTGTVPGDYDLIATGDLGAVGSALCRQMLSRQGITLGDNYTDCGLLLFDRQRQDVHAGGSGCGCSASVLCAHILPQMEQGQLKRVLFCPTGALMSPTSSQQGESIPGICHVVELVME